MWGNVCVLGAYIHLCISAVLLLIQLGRESRRCHPVKLLCLLQKGGGLSMEGTCLTLGNELSGDTRADKAETLLERVPKVRAAG